MQVLSIVGSASCVVEFVWTIALDALVLSVDTLSCQMACTRAHACQLLLSLGQTLPR